MMRCCASVTETSMVARAHLVPYQDGRKRSVSTGHSFDGFPNVDAPHSRRPRPGRTNFQIGITSRIPHCRRLLKTSSGGKSSDGLFVRRTQVRPFTPGEIRLLETFAEEQHRHQNVRLFQKLKDVLEQQTATSEIFGVIASSPMMGSRC